MQTIAKTDIIGLDSVLLSFCPEKSQYVIQYGENVETESSIDNAFQLYFMMIEKAYDDYR